MEYATGYEYDWQEEVFQKITSMKEMYLADLNDIHQRVEAKLQQDKLAYYENQIISFLNAYGPRVVVALHQSQA